MMEPQTDRFVLVLDEDSQPARYLTEHLGDDGVTVQFTSEPSEALDLAKGRTPALMVLSADVKEGLATVDKARKRRALADVPLVVLSTKGASAPLVAHYFQPTRADLYVRKPIDGDHLARYLGELRARWAEEDAPEIELEDESVDVVVESDGEADGIAAQDAALATALKSVIEKLEGELAATEAKLAEAEQQVQVGDALREERDDLRHRVEEFGGELEEARAGAVANAEVEVRAEELTAEVASLKELAEEGDEELAALIESAEERDE